MDPATALGLVGVAAQLLDETIEIIINLYKYYRKVHDGPTESAKLRSELDSLADLLTAIQETYERKPSGTEVPKGLVETIKGIRQLLVDLKKRTKPSETSGIRRLLWPFRQSENINLIGKLERFKASINIYVDLDLT